MSKFSHNGKQTSYLDVDWITCIGYIYCYVSISQVLNFDLELDWLKQKGAVKRTLLLKHDAAQHSFALEVGREKEAQCQDFDVYLRVSISIELSQTWLFIDEREAIVILINVG